MTYRLQGTDARWICRARLPSVILRTLTLRWHAAGMAEKAGKQPSDEFARFDLSDTGLGMYRVPASYRVTLDDADLACAHIAKKGLGGRDGVKGVQYFEADNQKLAVCQACGRAIAATKAAAAVVQ